MVSSDNFETITTIQPLTYNICSELDLSDVLSLSSYELRVVEMLEIIFRNTFGWMQKLSTFAPLF